jgi:hypothetical protein
MTAQVMAIVRQKVGSVTVGVTERMNRLVMI